MIRTESNQFKVGTWFEKEGEETYPEPRDTVANMEIMLPDEWDDMSLDEQESYLLGIAWENTKFEWKIRSPYSRVIQLELFMTVCDTVSHFPLVRFPKPDDWATMDEDARNEWIVDCIWGYARQVVVPVIRQRVSGLLWVGLLYVDTTPYRVVSYNRKFVEDWIIEWVEDIVGEGSGMFKTFADVVAYQTAENREIDVDVDLLYGYMDEQLTSIFDD